MDIKDLHQQLNAKIIEKGYPPLTDEDFIAEIVILEHRGIITNNNGNYTKPSVSDSVAGGEETK